MELNPSGEIGECIEHAALHNSLRHLYLANQKSIGRAQSKAGTKHPTYQYVKANRTRMMRSRHQNTEYNVT